MLPLHSEAQNAQYCKRSSHTGLWYDKFTRGWHTCISEEDRQAGRLLSFSSYAPTGGGEKKTPAAAWVKRLDKEVVGDPDMVKMMAIRQRQVAESLGGVSSVFATDWHFVTGMGNNHPVENGFAWHPTLGVPYLTGAAVKGLLRGWCEQWSDAFPTDGESKRDKLRLWFGPSLDELNPKKGSDIKKQKPAVGELIFFDAIPTRPVKIKADIMTPHYDKWYEEGESRPNRPDTIPADWHDPKPIPFLVVAPGQAFQFSVAKRTGSTVSLDEVTNALTEALKGIGAGAKTATGYGRMQRDEGEEKRILAQKKELEQQCQRMQEEENRRKKAQDEAEESGLTGIAFEMVREATEQGWNLDKGRFIPGANDWLARLDKEACSDTTHAACQWLSETLNRLHPGIMAEPDKVRGKKKKSVYKPATRELAHVLIERTLDDS